MEKETAIDFFFNKIKSHFENDGDLLETITFTYAIAKAKEKEKEKLTEKALVAILEVLNDCKNQLERDKEVLEIKKILPFGVEYIEKGILPEIEKAKELIETF
jgi:hemerythrin